VGFLGRDRTLFRVFGIPIKVNPTWLLLFGLIVFSLSGPGGMLREWAGEHAMSSTAFWVLGFVGALLLFASLLAHELCHCVVARMTGMPVRGITLFIFGGVSELGGEPPSATAEFFMAIVGPLSSMVIGAICLVVLAVGKAFFTWPAALNAMLWFLGTVNIWLAMFNSVPAFPLDGGRVVRSVLWALTDDLRRSTHVASTLGSILGMLMILMGVLAVFGVMPFALFSPIGGIWLIFIGLFVRQAASSSFQQVIMREALGGEPVSRFMTANPMTVTPELSVRRFVDECVLPHHFAVYPVVNQEGMLIGIVHALAPRGVHQAEWEQKTVRDVMSGVSADMLVSPNTDAADALVQLRGEQGRRLIVLQDGRPIGIVSLRDMLDFLALKIDLGS